MGILNTTVSNNQYILKIPNFCGVQYDYTITETHQLIFYHGNYINNDPPNLLMT